MAEGLSLGLPFPLSVPPSSSPALFHASGKKGASRKDAPRQRARCRSAGSANAAASVVLRRFSLAFASAMRLAGVNGRRR